jgi:hypothetical protein
MEWNSYNNNNNENEIKNEHGWFILWEKNIDSG